MPSYSHLLDEERDQIAALKAAGRSIGAIAKAVGRGRRGGSPCSGTAMLTIAADPKHLGARIGITAVLHTWGSALTHHPHVHMIVPDRRFLLHVLPKGFHRIRHYGLLFASGTRKANVARARKLLAAPAPADAPEPAPPADRRLPCPCCGGRMIVIESFVGVARPAARPHAAGAPDEAPRDPARPASKHRRSDTASAIGHARPGIGGHLPRPADDGRRGRHPGPARVERHPRTLLAPRLPGPRRYGAPVAGPPTPQPLGQIAIGRRSQTRGFVLGRFADAGPAPSHAPRAPAARPSALRRARRGTSHTAAARPNCHRPALQPRGFVLGRFADAGPAPGGTPCVGRHPQTFTFSEVSGHEQKTGGLSAAPPRLASASAGRSHGPGARLSARQQGGCDHAGLSHRHRRL